MYILPVEIDGTLRLELSRAFNRGSRCRLSAGTVVASKWQSGRRSQRHGCNE